MMSVNRVTKKSYEILKVLANPMPDYDQIIYNANNKFRFSIQFLP